MTAPDPLPAALHPATRARILAGAQPMKAPAVAAKGGQVRTERGAVTVLDNAGLARLRGRAGA